MTIQCKSGGNLSEALGNLAVVLRDRKAAGRQDQGDVVGSQGLGDDHRLAAARGDGLVYVTTPGYISMLFTERLGNLMLAACVFWMGTGIMVMRKMINFKH